MSRALPHEPMHVPILWRTESGKYPARSHTSQIPMLRRCIMDACRQGSVQGRDTDVTSRARSFVKTYDPVTLTAVVADPVYKIFRAI